MKKMYICGKGQLDMNNNKSITCTNCWNHYTNSFENPIGKQWCNQNKCVKAQKGDMRKLIREESVIIDPLKGEH